MKRIVCLLLAAAVLLALCACVGPTPTDEPGTTKAASGAPASTETIAPPSPAQPASSDAPTLPRPGDALSEEEQIAMWKAVLEKMAEDDLTPEEARRKAQASAELLIACGEELLALELPDRNESWTVTPLSGDWMALYQTRSRGLTDFESKNCRLLLELGTVEEIRIDGDRVCFSLGGRGLGSQTDYFDVYYIPSDDLSGCFGWSADLRFAERDGGCFAQGTGDNSFFYRQIAEHLYYCEAHF